MGTADFKGKRQILRSQKNDPAHVEVAQFLNGMERGKAQYIVDAAMAYQNGGGAAGIQGVNTKRKQRIFLLFRFPFSKQLVCGYVKVW